MSAEQAASATLDVLDRTFVECSALGFQSVVTSILAVACYVLWRRQRRPYFLTWSAAWAVYVVRLACMSTFLVRRDMVWLFLHQSATGISALLLLLAALQLSRGLLLRPYHGLVVPLSLAWAWFTIYEMHSMLVAGTTSTLLLSFEIGPLFHYAAPECMSFDILIRQCHPSVDFGLVYRHSFARNLFPQGLQWSPQM